MIYWKAELLFEVDESIETSTWKYVGTQSTFRYYAHLYGYYLSELAVPNGM